MTKNSAVDTTKRGATSAAETSGENEAVNKDGGVLYLGIDLGTSRTSVASSNGQRVTIARTSAIRRTSSPQAPEEGHPLRRRSRRAPPSCRFYRPLAAGVLKLSNNKTDDVEGNMKAAADLIREIIRQSQPAPDELVYAVIGVPAQAAIHHKDAIVKAARESVDSVMLCSEPFSRRVRPRHARRRARHRHRRRHDGPVPDARHDAGRQRPAHEHVRRRLRRQPARGDGAEEAPRSAVLDPDDQGDQGALRFGRRQHGAGDDRAAGERQADELRHHRRKCGRPAARSFRRWWKVSAS
jgi:hypothetical protein